MQNKIIASKTKFLLKFFTYLKKIKLLTFSIIIKDKIIKVFREK